MLLSINVTLEFPRGGEGVGSWLPGQVLLPCGDLASPQEVLGALPYPSLHLLCTCNPS